MTARYKVRGTNGSSKEEPVFVTPGDAVRVVARHGAVGWRYDLFQGDWNKVIFHHSMGWIPYLMREIVYGKSDFFYDD